MATLSGMEKIQIRNANTRISVAGTRVQVFQIQQKSIQARLAQGEANATSAAGQKTALIATLAAKYKVDLTKFTLNETTFEFEPIK